MSTFTTKVYRTVQSCRKGVLLAAVAAMASGAWADIAYTFQFTLNNMPEEYHTGLYLIDTENGKIVAYATQKELINFVTGSTVTHENGSKVSIGQGAYAGEYDVVGHSITSLSHPGLGGEGGEQSFQITFTSTDALIGANAKHDEDGVTLAYVALATNQDPGYDAIDNDGVKWSKVGASGSGNVSYQAYFEYSSSVPEPTSAMLLLLGFAGLALKRKVA